MSGVLGRTLVSIFVGVRWSYPGRACVWHHNECWLVSRCQDWRKGTGNDGMTRWSPVFRSSWVWGCGQKAWFRKDVFQPGREHLARYRDRSEHGCSRPCNRRRRSGWAQNLYRSRVRPCSRCIFLFPWSGLSFRWEIRVNVPARFFRRRFRIPWHLLLGTTWGHIPRWRPSWFVLRRYSIMLSWNLGLPCRTVQRGGIHEYTNVPAKRRWHPAGEPCRVHSSWEPSPRSRLTRHHSPARSWTFFWVWYRGYWRGRIVSRKYLQGIARYPRRNQGRWSGSYPFWFVASGYCKGLVRDRQIGLYREWQVWI